MTDPTADTTLSADTQAALLLHGRLGRASQEDAKPLALGEFNQLGAWLRQEGLRPSDLLRPDGAEHVARLPASVLDPDRVLSLLSRGVALAFAVEEWMRRGIWVVGRADAAYPPQLRARLRSAAPPLLFGVGDTALLHRRALGVVGSRDADDRALSFTRDVGVRCAREGLGVVSGGAKGVDLEAMLGALEAGGEAVGVLAEGVAKPAVSRRYREWIASGRLALVSPYHPETRWASYQAMDRNKVVYGMSERVVVVSSDTRGGTWEGAVENLKQGWVSVFVRIGADVPAGNRRLIELGAFPLPGDRLGREGSLSSLLDAAEERVGGTGDLFSQPPPPVPRPADEGGDAYAGDGAYDHRSDAPEVRERPPGTDLFLVVWPHLAPAFQEEVYAKALGDVADRLDIQHGQLMAWLRRAVAEGLVEKRTEPVRYVVTRAS